jgi:hypothetical protein
MTWAFGIAVTLMIVEHTANFAHQICFLWPRISGIPAHRALKKFPRDMNDTGSVCAEFAIGDAVPAFMIAHRILFFYLASPQ